ncbi:MAG: hypothetical protein HY548_05355, partial [Elusimicrobia bacterium]|nr:hypothetical protein [Elusimicrobiota bacterium]
AKAAFEKGEVKEAGIFIRKGVRLGRSMEWLQSNFGSLWSQWGAKQTSPEDSRAALMEARRFFERTLAIDPYFAQGHFGMGYVRLQEKRYREAAAAFGEAARTRTDWPEALYMQGLAYTFFGSPESAREPWERFLALEPGSPLAQGVKETLAGNQ